MPIFEYRCPTCEAQVEVLVRSQKTTPACPECASPLTQGKLFSVPHVMSSTSHRPSGHTCCGRDERCDSPPCSGQDACRRD